MTSPQLSIIADINDTTFYPDRSLAKDPNSFKVRVASRGLLLHKNTVALLHVAKNNYHKLPGGGVEAGETKQQAFLREILEETGCHSQIIDHGGITLEHRYRWDLIQMSYIYLAEVVGEPGTPNFDSWEIDDGFSLRWIPITKLKQSFNEDDLTDYEVKFIHQRDTQIIQHYYSQLDKHS